jgi:hypothetical protein
MAQNEILGGGGSVSQPAAVIGLTAPDGLEQIVTTFGNIQDYIRADGSLDPKRQADFLTRIDLPFPLSLSWNTASKVNQMTCHKRMADVFTEVLQRVQAQELQEKISTFGGCFSFRPQRTGSKLSTHAWGIAVDLNPVSNAQGTAGDMDSQVIAIFRGAGFEWGGEWEGKSRDPMHFQFCTGY